MEGGDIGVNRRSWDAYADTYQELHREQLAGQMFSGDIAWGVWGIPESTLHVLGDVTGKRVLEFGCGAAQLSIAIARAGGHAVGFDLSLRQLEHARRSMNDADLRVPTVQAAGEQIPFADSTFDIVFADYGAFTFANPYRAIPEAARVLRPGGLLTFLNVHPILTLAWRGDAEHPSDTLLADYFEMFQTVDDDGSHDYQLPISSWVSLFSANRLQIEDVIEPRPAPDAESTYRDAEHRAWARRWPAEIIWRLRKR